jgi:hypothetical protein
MQEPTHYDLPTGVKRTVELLPTFFKVQVTIGGRPNGTVKLRFRPILSPDTLKDYEVTDEKNPFPPEQFEHDASTMTITLSPEGVKTIVLEYKLFSALMFDDTANATGGRYWASVFQFNDHW